MARTFNMSQFKNQIRQAQHKAERQLKQIQRDTERKMKKRKIFKLIISSSIGMIGMGLVILIPVLMLLDFFGVNITDGYVENNNSKTR